MVQTIHSMNLGWLMSHSAMPDLPSHGNHWFVCLPMFIPNIGPHSFHEKVISVSARYGISWIGHDLARI